MKFNIQTLSRLLPVVLFLLNQPFIIIQQVFPMLLLDIDFCQNLNSLIISVLIFFFALSFLLSPIDIFWRPLFCLMTFCHFLDDNFAVIVIFKSITARHNYFKGPWNC